MKTYHYLLQSDAYAAIEEEDWYSIDKDKQQYTVYSGDEENLWVAKNIYKWEITDITE